MDVYNEVNNGLLDDNDEEFIEFFEHERRPYKVCENRPDYISELDDLDFKVRFRISKQTTLEILELIEGQLETPTDRNHAIRPIEQLLLTLRFFATGSFLLTVADFIYISKTSALKIVKKVSDAIAQLSPRFIKMPTQPDEIHQAQLQFHQKARLPRVIGSIDCTHIKLQSPGGNNAEVFRNRKGYFSINVQTIAATNLKILDVVARWPGSVHDQTIFDNSSIKRRLENGEFDDNFGNALFVGDSGYANTNHVITPFVNTRNEVEELYNESVTRTRNPVERQYGVWKRRFPVLSTGLATSPNIIVAVAVLHNISIEQDDIPPPDDPGVDFENIDFNEDHFVEPLNRQNARNARDQLIADYFPGLLL